MKSADILAYIWITGQPCKAPQDYNRRLFVKIGGLLYPRQAIRPDTHKSLRAVLEREILAACKKKGIDPSTVSMYDKETLRNLLDKFLGRFRKEGRRWQRSWSSQQPSLDDLWLARGHGRSLLGPVSGGKRSAEPSTSDKGSTSE